MREERFEKEIVIPTLSVKKVASNLVEWLFKNNLQDNVDYDVRDEIFLTVKAGDKVLQFKFRASIRLHLLFMPMEPYGFMVEVYRLIEERKKLQPTSPQGRLNGRVHPPQKRVFRDLWKTN